VEGETGGLFNSEKNHGKQIYEVIKQIAL